VFGLSGLYSVNRWNWDLGGEVYYGAKEKSGGCKFI